MTEVIIILASSLVAFWLGKNYGAINTIKYLLLNTRAIDDLRNESLRLNPNNLMIRIDTIDDTLFAYDDKNNTFLLQGYEINDMLKKISDNYPNKTIIYEATIDR